MKINKLFLTFVLVFCFSFNLFSEQSSALLKDFVAGNLNDKIHILKITKSTPIESFVNENSFNFIESYYTLLENDDTFKELICLTIEGLPKKNTPRNADALQRVFLHFEDEKIKIAVIEKIPQFEDNTDELINLLNNFVKNSIQENTYESKIFLAAVKSLSECAHPSSFHVLFSCYVANISTQINEIVEKSLKTMAESNKAQIIAIIANNPPKEKLLALRISNKKHTNNDYFSAEIAENALAITINLTESKQDISEDLVTLQLEAMRIISEFSWTRASSLIIRYFDVAKQQFKNNIISKNDFIDVIVCMSRLATVEIGKTLASYLGTLNLETEKTGSYDKDIILAVINSLGVLGEKSAFDYLLYVISFSNYSEEIISASRDALSRLKW
ncbi:MAG: hypothetical protein GX220_07205 [Treponema sp.]|nr:hypothetical protein [Treponema sp.]